MFNIDVKIIKRNDRDEITHSEDFDIFKVPVLPRIGEKMEWCGYKDEPVLKTYKGKPYSVLVMDYVEVYTVVDIIYQWENLSDEGRL